MKIKKVLPRLVKYSLPCALIVPNVLFSEGLPINTDLNTDAAGPVNVTINDTSYEVSSFNYADHYGVSNFEDLFAIPDSEAMELTEQFFDLLINTNFY